MKKKSKKFSLTKNIDKYGIINLIIWVSIPIILTIVIVSVLDIDITSIINPDKNFGSYLFEYKPIWTFKR